MHIIINDLHFFKTEFYKFLVHLFGSEIKVIPISKTKATDEHLHDFCRTFDGVLCYLINL